eukprot:GHVQ01039778.1.p1 GENE.GHVQ01039778.1~~GHVQ01039778.1.p1  ORF type:complete len:410 (+),score=45.38 GHVQ01039778.1:241-1470(+)
MSVPTVQLKTPLPHHRGRWNHLPFLSNYLMGYALLVGVFSCIAEVASLQTRQLTTWHSPETSSRDNPWMRTPSPAVPHVSVVVQERGLQVTTVPTGDSTTVATEPSSVVSPSLRRVALLWGFPVVLTVVVTHQFDRRSKFFTARYAAYSAVAYGTARMQRYIDPNFNLPWPGHDSRWSSLLYKIFSITWPGHDSIWPLFFYNILGIILVDRIFMWLSTPSDVGQDSVSRRMPSFPHFRCSLRCCSDEGTRFFVHIYTPPWLHHDQAQAPCLCLTDAVWDAIKKTVMLRDSSTAEITDESLQEALTNGDSPCGLFIVSDKRYKTPKAFVAVLPSVGKTHHIVRYNMEDFISSEDTDGCTRASSLSEDELDKVFQGICRRFKVHSQKWDFKCAFKAFWDETDDEITAGNQL